MIKTDKRSSLSDFELIINEVNDFVTKNNMDLLKNGRHEIDGDKLYVNILEYDTKPEEQCLWEAHRKYYDLHYIISGEEIIKIGRISSSKVESYTEDLDYVALTSDAESIITCHPGDFLFLDCEDAHLTGAMINGKTSHIKKAVFKILI